MMDDSERNCFCQPADVIRNVCPVDRIGGGISYCGMFVRLTGGCR